LAACEDQRGSAARITALTAFQAGAPFFAVTVRPEQMRTWPRTNL
jgi:hypothetical protein